MGDDDPMGRKQDPRVEGLRPDPSQPTPRIRPLAGLWGDSDRPGYARLYLTRDLTVYAEFRVEDVVMTTDIPSERAPFLGEQATRIELPYDANIELTRSHRISDVDDFDLDLRLGTRVAFASVGFASSGPDDCLKGADDTDWPCGDTCDAFLCPTFIGPRGGQCPGGGRGRDSADCPTGTCVGATNCGTCDTNFGATNCGTCDTDFGQTNCGGCNRVRRR